MEHDLKFWKKLATDMVVVLGNNLYMAKAAMMSWITKMSDAEEQVSLLALADNITKRLLEIKPEEKLEYATGKKTLKREWEDESR